MSRQGIDVCCIRWYMFCVLRNTKLNITSAHILEYREIRVLTSRKSKGNGARGDRSSQMVIITLWCNQIN